MKLYEELLETLSSSEEPISGSELAERFGVSRNAVWKSINKMKEEGYLIKSSKSGYVLSRENPHPVSEDLKKALGTDEVILLECVDSTNNIAKELAIRGAKEGTAVFALEQTSGKGRLGRTFVSNRGGIYFSVILRPQVNADSSVFITVAAAAAVSKTLREVFNKPFPIKWVNDIFCGDKKVCGILTEGSFNAETMMFDFAVLGIGINLADQSDNLPEDVKLTAGSLCSEKTVPASLYTKIASGVYKKFFEYYADLSSERKFMNYYIENSYLDNKDVMYIKDGRLHSAKALRINSDAGLVLEEDGKITVLKAGEVSVKRV